MADENNYSSGLISESGGAAGVLRLRRILKDRRAKIGVYDIMTLLHDLVYILAAVVLVFSFFIRVVNVDGASMEPTLQERDQLVLLSNLWYRQPQRGDIVVARIPDFSDEPIVKRVIAVEGDEVFIDFEKGTVSVNGMLLEEAYVTGPTTRYFAKRPLDFPVTIEEGCVFLLGDNRSVSVDSRYAVIGQVDQRYILGKVIYLMLPGSDEATHIRDYDRIGAVD